MGYTEDMEQQIDRLKPTLQALQIQGRLQEAQQLAIHNFVGVNQATLQELLSKTPQYDLIYVDLSQISWVNDQNEFSTKAVGTSELTIQLTIDSPLYRDIVAVLEKHKDDGKENNTHA